MGSGKRKQAFEHALIVRFHIILRFRKVYSGPVSSIDVFYNIQWF